MKKVEKNLVYEFEKLEIPRFTVRELYRQSKLVGQSQGHGQGNKTIA